MATEDSVMAVIRASRPNFRNPNDKMAFAVHASFLATGYSLIATGARAFSEHPPIDGDEVGTEGWNDFEDSYAFVYLKSVKGSKKPILVKCLVIGDALVVDVLNLKEDHKEPFHIQINVKEHLSSGDNKNYGEMYKNVPRLLEILNAGVFSKLEPKGESSSSGSRSNEPVDTFPVERQQPPPVLRNPPISSPGNSDLYPGPGAGIYPSRGSGIGGGMLVGPNDPRWFGTDENPGPNFAGGNLVPPGSRFDPIGPPDIPGFRPENFIRVPPGSRFDPIGPPDIPGFRPENFIRNPQRRPGQGGGIHPDLEHFHDFI